jgi:3-oxoacyl-[acyl-carrier protein] reductase
MLNSAKKPVAIITGASRGVGAATALLLASKGWNVTITCSSTIKEANEIAKLCEAYDVEALAIQADVSIDADCKNTIEQTVKKWGRLDALINNAGTTKFAWDHSNLDLLDAEDFQKVYEVNLIGPFQMIKASKEFLMKSDNPSITNVSSIAGIKGIGSSIAYAASKGALNTMTISMARNLGPIRVNAICPGFIDGEWLKVALGEELFDTAKTNLESSVPLKSVATPETIAESILAFISLNKNATGQLLILDGGHHLSL